jgi:FMN phosphatase YigB (HAD superfamily)
VGQVSYRALLFDIGEVISPEQWATFDDIERATGRVIVGRGPMDPEGDPLWQRYLRGELSFTGYWYEFAQFNGYDDWRQLFRDTSSVTPGDRFVHPAAAALISDARQAGLLLGALTNDGVGIAGRAWFDSVPTLAAFDAFCDAQAYGGKPAAAAYLAAARELGVEPAEVIFLDDTTVCVDGARAIGMAAVLVDPMDRDTAFAEVRMLAGIGDVGTAQRIVDDVDAAYRTNDLDRIMGLFDPDISISWNGRRVALGAVEARRFHVEVLGLRAEATPGSGPSVRRQLRAASGSSISVECSSWIDGPDGLALQSGRAELWTMRRGLIVEWHVYGELP